MTNAEFNTFLTSAKTKLNGAGMETAPYRGQAYIQEWIDAITAAGATPYSDASVRVRGHSWVQVYLYCRYILDHNLYH